MAIVSSFEKKFRIQSNPSEFEIKKNIFLSVYVLDPEQFPEKNFLFDKLNGGKLFRMTPGEWSTK
jgi:hypothetical protein